MHTPLIVPKIPSYNREAQQGILDTITDTPSTIGAQQAAFDVAWGAYVFSKYVVGNLQPFFSMLAPHNSMVGRKAN